MRARAPDSILSTSAAGRGNFLDHMAGEQGGGGRLAIAAELHDGEFVTAQPRSRVVLGDAFAETTGDRCGSVARKMNKPFGCGTGMALVNLAFAQTRCAHAKTPCKPLAARRFASICCKIISRRRTVLKA